MQNNNPLPDTLPPHNLEAEQALLGAILVDNKAFDQVVEYVVSNHFYSSVHGDIYEALKSMISAGKLASPVTAKMLFDGSQRVDAHTTIAQYLGRLAARATTTVNARAYGETIVDLARRREAISLLKDAIEEVSQPALDRKGGLIAETLDKIGQLWSTHGDDRRYFARNADEVEARPIEWFWPRRIALGKVTIFAGDPGVGKSQLRLLMAGIASTGGEWPDGSRCPNGSVVVISCEDDPSDTIKPRLVAAGASVPKVYFFDAVRSKSSSNQRVPFCLSSEGEAALRQFLADIGDVVLVIVDPISAYMGRANCHKTSDVRIAMNHLERLAAEFKCCVLLVSHLNKNEAGDGLSRVSGPIAFVAASRSAYVVGFDPKDTTRETRVLAPLKNNLGDDREAFLYTVENAVLPGGIETSRAVFRPGAVQISYSEILGPKDDTPSASGDAKDFLSNTLSAGPMSSKSVFEAAHSAGISYRTLRRAQVELGIEPYKLSGQNGNWMWALPNSSTETKSNST